MQPEKFCKAPFKTAVIDTDGALLPCCEFMTHKSKLAPYKLNAKNTKMFKDWWENGLDPLREKMLNGEIDPGCEHCLSKEKNPNQIFRFAKVFKKSKFSEKKVALLNPTKTGLK